MAKIGGFGNFGDALGASWGPEPKGSWDPVLTPCVGIP